MSSLNLGELYATMSVRNDGWRRGLAGARGDMVGFQRDAQGRLRDIRGQFIAEGEAAGVGFGQGVRAGAAPGLDGFSVDTNGRLRDAQGRYASSGAEAGRGFGNSLLSGITPSMGALGRIMAGATSIAAFATAGAGAASALGPLLGLVGTLATAVAGLGAAVPAFAAGAAVAIATLTVGFSGMGAAIAGDEAALERLAPAARDVVDVLADLRPAWADVTRSVQERMFSGLAADIAVVAGDWLPRLKDGLGIVADGFNAVGAAALGALAETEVIDGFNAVVEHTGAGLEAFAAGVSPWLQGIGILLQAFAPLLTSAGEAAAGLGQRFYEWISQAEQTGDLAALIDSMATTLGLVGDIAMNLGSILGSVFSATAEAGGGLLGTIASLSAELSAFLASAEGQTALSSFFTSLAEVGGVVVPIVLQLVEAFANGLAPIVGDIATGAGPGLLAVVTALGDALSRIDIMPLAEAFGGLLASLAPILIPAAEVLNVLISMSPVLVPLAAGLGALTIAQWALNAAMTANPIGIIIVGIGLLIAGIVALVQNWDTVKEKTLAVFGAIGDFIAEWWPWLLAISTGGLSLIVDFIIDNWDEISETTRSIFSAIGDFFSDFWDSTVGYVETKVNEFLLVVGWLGRLPDKVAGWFEDIYNGAKNQLNALVNWASGIFDKILDVLGNPGDLLLDVGRNIIQGLIEGIQGAFGEVEDLLGDLTSSLPDWKGPESLDRIILRRPAQVIMGGFLDTLGEEGLDVRRFFEGLTTDIGLQVASAAPATAAAIAPAVTRLSDEDRAALVGARREAPNQTFNVYGTDTDVSTLAAELDWLGRRP